jgi:hypothetical protein
MNGTHDDHIPVKFIAAGSSALLQDKEAKHTDDDGR